MSSPAGPHCLLFLALTPCVVAQGDSKPSPPGHSVHGEAFDEGPREQAWRMSGMGDVSFPVTTSSPDAQTFINQGVAQLHTFYYFEAERSFRQAALLDSNCPMAYWGMAMANHNNGKRASGFLRKARDRIDKATPHERLYIEALEAYRKEGRGDGDRRRDFIRGLEAVVLKFPGDIEAKAFLAWAVVMLGEGISSHVAVDVLIEEVLRRAPHHPGAHHYRIHLWDHRDPEQALRSAQEYARAAPGIAHAWHMPGHIYNGLSQWKNASYQQAASACVDHKHMYDHLLLPFQIHNYAHNQHYLIANLSHLGGVRDAIDFARNLIETPRDPGNEGAQGLGRASLLRIYLRYQRWADILDDPRLEWGPGAQDQAWKSYSRGFAHLGKGDMAAAGDELASLDKRADEALKKPGHEADVIETLRLELRGRVRVREGKLLAGFEDLARAAKLQGEKFAGDLSGYPRPVLESIGEAHLEAQNWGLAEDCFRAVLESRKDTFVSLAGHAEALHRRGKHDEARVAYGKFLDAWQSADKDLPHRSRLEALGIAVVSGENGAGKTLLAGGGDLLRLEAIEERALPDGPRLWTPTPAPDFDLEDSGGGRVRLESLRGKWVVLAFYLGGACGHCLEQLVTLGKEKEALEKLSAVALGLSDDTPARSKELLAGSNAPKIPFLLLSDPERKVARAYGAHDTFEDLALHGLYLIDPRGGIRWYRISAEPFTDVGFIKSEIERLQRYGIK